MEKPKDFNDPDQWYKTDQNIISSVNGIYAQLRTGDYYGQKFPFATEAFAGSWDAKGTDYTKFQFVHSNRNVFAQDNVLSAIWKTLYQTIGMANTTIDRISGSSGNLTPELRSRVIAEARFLRALTYFNLVRCWEEIPLRKIGVLPLKILQNLPHQ